MARVTKDIKSIFAEAIKKATSEEISLYLDNVCSSDATLRVEIESLLAAHSDAGKFLAGRAPSRSNLEQLLAGTNCWKRLARAAWLSFIWPSRPNRFAVKSH